MFILDWLGGLVPNMTDTVNRARDAAMKALINPATYGPHRIVQDGSSHRVVFENPEHQRAYDQAMDNFIQQRRIVSP